MRLSLGLPLLQTIVMILILWAPATHKFDIVLRDGREIRGWSVHLDLTRTHRMGSRYQFAGTAG
jgi:hypothetical protein